MFQKDFAWGVSTAAYQFEGGAHEDGKGESIWDVFSRRAGAVARGETAEVSSDHYHRWAEDVDVMAELGLNAYRMSVSWPRILPDGTGRVNEAGLDFYDRVFDRCLEKGIEPYVTLYHWDLPQKLAERGGWLNRECADWFADFSALCARRFSDRVKQFIPLNEPTCALVLGYSIGVHAPGFRLGRGEANAAAHHMLLAHGKSVSALRANARQPLSIGTATVANVRTPVGDAPADVEAARRATFDPDKWAENAAFWLDPIYLGSFAQQEAPGNESYFDAVRPGDLELISQPIEYVGINIYHSFPVSAAADGAGTGGAFCPQGYPAGYPKTSMGWPVTPEALYYGPKFFAERYPGRPVVLTENGVALPDWVSLDGRVHDPNREDFLRRYLKELRRAAGEFDVKGYFYWTLLDNFEWSEGFDKRFGLVHVDYETGKRTVKDSAAFYREVVRSNGENL